MYTSRNFKTKKELKKAVDKYNAGIAARRFDPSLPPPRKITIYQPNNMFGTPDPITGTHAVEGPHYPEPHKWYASVTLEDGAIVKVR